MARTLLALLVPEAEPVVGSLRAMFDPAAARGLGAHITLVYPFLDSDAIDELVITQLEAVAARHAAIEFSLPTVRTFHSVAWLAPDPPAPIVALASDLEVAFPDRPLPPVQHSAYTPHLTAARSQRARLSSVVCQLRDRLWANGVPECRCADFSLLQLGERGWVEIGRFHLVAEASNPRTARDAVAGP